MVSLTAGEAKGILKEMLDSGRESDGFVAVVVLQTRYDAVTTGSLLQSYLEVVVPPAIKNAGEIVSTIHKWGAEVALLESRYEERINVALKRETCPRNVA